MHACWAFYEEYNVVTELGVDLNDSIGISYPPMSVFQAAMMTPFFVDIPFILSQQVYIWPILSSDLLWNSMDSLQYSIQQSLSAITYDEGDGGREQLSCEIISEWQNRHMHMLKFARKISSNFSVILLVLCSCDFMIILGYTAGIVNHFQEKGWVAKFLGRYVCGIVVFAVYQTVFAVPFVRLYEKNADLAFALDELSQTFSHNSIKQPKARCVKNVLSSLQLLREQCRNNVMAIDGGNLYIYTRNFLLGTLTLACSLAIVIKEVVGKDDTTCGRICVNDTSLC